MTAHTARRYNAARNRPQNQREICLTVTDATDVTLPFAPDQIEAVLFDMDGTIMNTDDADVSKWARRIARVYRSPERAETAARRLVMALESPGNAVFTVLDWLGLDTFVIRLMIGLQGTGLVENVPPIAGIKDMSKALAAHYRLGIVSTRTAGESAEYLEALGIDQHFAVIVGRDTTWRIKPHPEPVISAAATLELPPDRCLMVGDTTVDIKAGRRAGAWTCGVLCGYGERGELELAGADFILPHTALLSETMLGKNGRTP